MTKVFIDGSAGTTGLRIKERLADRNDIELVTLPEELRKDPAARKKALNDADIVFLCLPDAASIEAVAMIENDHTVVIDSFSDSVELPKNTTDSFALDLKYDDTVYTDASGSVVMVTYSDGTNDVHFVLNYNLYDVNVRLKGVNGDKAFVVPAYGFQRIEGASLVTK